MLTNNTTITGGSQKTSEDRPVVIMDHAACQEASDVSPVIKSIKKGKVASPITYENVNINSFEEYC